MLRNSTKGRPPGPDIRPFFDWTEQNWPGLSDNELANLLDEAFRKVLGCSGPDSKTIAGWRRTGRAAKRTVTDLLRCAEGHPDPPWRLLVPLLRDLLNKKALATPEEATKALQSKTSPNELSPLPDASAVSLPLEFSLGLRHIVLALEPVIVGKERCSSGGLSVVSDLLLKPGDYYNFSSPELKRLQDSGNLVEKVNYVVVTRPTVEQIGQAKQKPDSRLSRRPRL